MKFFSKFFSSSSDPLMSVSDRLRQGKSYIENQFDPYSYCNPSGGCCAVGGYARTFVDGTNIFQVRSVLNKPEVRQGIALLNEATFVVTGGDWRNIENLAMCNPYKDLVLKVYDKAIELAEIREESGERVTPSEDSINILNDKEEGTAPLSSRS